MSTSITPVGARHLPAGPLAALSLALALAAVPARAADGDAVVSETPKAGRIERVAEFIDRLPDVIDNALPNFRSRELFQIYVNPRFGDLLHRDYLRVPVGVRAKFSQMSANAEVQSYYTHGLGSAAGYGFSGYLLGVKHESAPSTSTGAGWSTGLNFTSPLGRPPIDLTDGYRHTVPYIGATYPLAPSIALTGFATLSADFLNSTHLTPHFGINQLHTNALGLAVGVAREYRYFVLSTAVTHNNSSLISNEHGHVTSIKPSILIPIKSWPVEPVRLLLTFGAKVVWGPDGRETGLTTGLRVEIDLHNRQASTPKEGR